jgi:hypothetical protein
MFLFQWYFNRLTVQLKWKEIYLFLINLLIINVSYENILMYSTNNVNFFNTGVKTIKTLFQ